jgi:thiamine kinase-like enzyme
MWRHTFIVVLLLFVLKIVSTRLMVNNRVIRVFNWYVKTNTNSDEVAALIALQKHYACRCHPPRQHFPRIVFVFPLPPVRTIHITISRGTSLDRVNNVEVPRNIHVQCECIFDNMRRAGVRHLDLAPKNVCIDHQGTISLIDFEIANGPTNPLYLNKSISKRATYCADDLRTLVENRLK